MLQTGCCLFVHTPPDAHQSGDVIGDVFASVAVAAAAVCVSWPRFWHWGTGPLRGCVCWQMSLCLPHELLGPAGALQAHSCRGKAARSGDCSPCSCGGEQLMCCVKDRQRDTARPLHASPRRALCLARHHHAYRNGMVRDKEYHFSRDRAVVSGQDGLQNVFISKKKKTTDLPQDLIYI